MRGGEDSVHNLCYVTAPTLPHTHLTLCSAPPSFIMGAGASSQSAPAAPADLLTALDGIAEGDGTLLDNLAVFAHSGTEFPKQHGTQNSGSSHGSWRSTQPAHGSEVSGLRGGSGSGSGSGRGIGLRLVKGTLVHCLQRSGPRLALIRLGPRDCGNTRRASQPNAAPPGPAGPSP